MTTAPEPALATAARHEQMTGATLRAQERAVARDAAKSEFVSRDPPPTGGVSFTLCVVDDDRARELLQRERERIESELARLSPGGSLEGDDNWEPGDRDSEDLYQDELNEGRRTELQTQIAAVARAEARLEAGTYGLSIESGDPIPDARLEALPTAERTVEEAERHPRG